MPLLDSFVGGAYKHLYPTLAADQAINVFPETRRVEGSQKQKWLIGTPGRKTFAEVVGGPCRGWFSQDGRTFAVIAATLYEVDTGTAVLTTIGTILDNGEPVSYASNGKGGDQIGIVGGDQLKIFDTSTNILSAAIILPFSGPVQIAFQDAYFLINQRNTPTVWFSALEDGTSWDALDFIARSGSSDNVLAIASTQDRVWLWGTRTTTLFYNSGDADTPFLPYPGTTTQIGAVSPWAITQRGEVFTWVARSANEGLMVVKASGVPTPITVSTPPIEQWLTACPSLTGIETLAYSSVGHAFVAVTAPLSPDEIKTYVWDDLEQQWHARADWDATNGLFTRWRARGVCQVGGTVFVGDYSTGVLSTLDESTYTDNGGVLVRDRTMPYPSDENQWLFLDQVELGAQVGVGLSSGQGSVPVADLYISRDAGQTFVACGAASLGAIGAFLVRVIWRRLGRVRMDRFLLRVRQSDPVKVAWLGLYLRSTGGTNQL